MDLKEYIRENGALTVYRVIHENTDEEDQQVISKNLSTTDAPEEVVEEAYLLARRVIFEEAETEFSLEHTDPEPYLTPVETSIVDICVIAESEKEASEKFQEDLGTAEERRRDLLEYREEKVKPFLERIRDRVDLTGFRGDLVMPGRKATPFSDINVVLATQKKVDEILDVLEESPGAVEYLDRITPAKGDRFLVERDAPVVSYDIWETGDFRDERKKDREEGTYKKLYFDTMEVFYTDL